MVEERIRKKSLDNLERFREVISNELFIYKKIKKKTKQGKKERTLIYQPYNQMITCIIRIRETSQYINELVLRKENSCGEAFDFYELINCISIIQGCVNSLFDCLSMNLDKEYGSTKIFTKSNSKNVGDIKFFKFIRSATSVHPEETTRYNKITTVEHEFYPYATWGVSPIILPFMKDAPKGFDIVICSWNSRPSCRNKHYYLYLEEFYEFANHLVDMVSRLIPGVEQIIEEQKEKIRCKRLKTYDQFESEKEYCLYLRKRLEKYKKGKYEFPDGGLLIASHIFENDLLCDEFKLYILDKVIELSEQMTKDITEISYCDVTDELSLYDIIKNYKTASAPNYIAEKFDSYLEREAKYEIEAKEFKPFRTSFREVSSIDDFNDAEWSINLLCQLNDFYDISKLQRAFSFTDFYEITLETIWRNLKEAGKI